jgi:hypothetical protein
MTPIEGLSDEDLEVFRTKVTLTVQAAFRSKASDEFVDAVLAASERGYSANIARRGVGLAAGELLSAVRDMAKRYRGVRNAARLLEQKFGSEIVVIPTDYRDRPFVSLRRLLEEQIDELGELAESFDQFADDMPKPASNRTRNWALKKFVGLVAEAYMQHVSNGRIHHSRNSRLNKLIVNLWGHISRAKPDPGTVQLLLKNYSRR